MTIYICPYSKRSSSAKTISKLTSTPLIRGNKLHTLNNDGVIFWGKPKEISLYNEFTVKLINSKIEAALNKEKFHLSTHQFSCRPSSYSYPLHRTYIKNKLGESKPNKKWITYKYLTSKGGNGISCLTTTELSTLIDNDTLDAQLITEYIPKKVELRVHANVFSNKVPYLIQQKKLKTAFPRNDNTFNVRSHKNGWIFSTNLSSDSYKEILGDLTSNSNIFSRILQELNLWFGAFDVIISNKDKVYILELNTAPGIESTETTNYYTNLMNQCKTSLIKSIGQ